MIYGISNLKDYEEFLNSSKNAKMTNFEYLIEKSKNEYSKGMELLKQNKKINAFNHFQYSKELKNEAYNLTLKQAMGIYNEN